VKAGAGITAGTEAGMGTAAASTGTGTDTGTGTGTGTDADTGTGGVDPACVSLDSHARRGADTDDAATAGIVTDGTAPPEGSARARAARAWRVT